MPSPDRPYTRAQQEAIDAVRREPSPYNDLLDMARELRQSLIDDVDFFSDEEGLSYASVTGGQ